MDSNIGRNDDHTFSDNSGNDVISNNDNTDIGNNHDDNIRNKYSYDNDDINDEQQQQS